MRKLIAITSELAEKIKEVAKKDGFSFSREICYLAYIGLEHLAEINKNNPDLYNKYKPNFNFDVDNPKRKVINSDY